MTLVEVGGGSGHLGWVTEDRLLLLGTTHAVLIVLSEFVSLQLVLIVLDAVMLVMGELPIVGVVGCL